MWEEYANKSTGIACKYSLLELLNFYCDYSKSKFEDQNEILMPRTIQYIPKQKLLDSKRNIAYEFLENYIVDYDGLKKHQADLDQLQHFFISLKFQERYSQEKELRIHYPLRNDHQLVNIIGKTQTKLGLGGIDKIDPYIFAKKHGISNKKLINLQYEESKLSIETFFHEKHNIKPFIAPHEIIMGYNISPESKTKIIDEFRNTEVSVYQISKDIDRDGYYKKICCKN